MLYLRLAKILTIWKELNVILHALLRTTTVAKAAQHRFNVRDAKV